MLEEFISRKKGASFKVKGFIMGVVMQTRTNQQKVTFEIVKLM